MRLKSGDFQARQLPQSTDWSEEIAEETNDQANDEANDEVNNEGVEQVVGQKVTTANKFSLDVNPKKLGVALAILLVLFVAPLMLWNGASNLLGLASPAPFSQAIVQPQGQVAGVSTEASASTDYLTDINADIPASATENLDSNNNGSVLGANTSFSQTGLPLGTILIALGLVLVAIPVVVLLRS